MVTLEACEALLNASANVTIGSNATGCPGGSNFEPSTILCVFLSGIGGLLEVTSTMCLAYPAYKKKTGTTYTWCQEQLMIVANLSLMIVASVAYVIGSWFGPVSLAVPTIMVSKLLFNMLIIGTILRMEDFTREQKIGVYCITCAILTLPEIGPTDQPCMDAPRLIYAPAAVIWELILFGATGAVIAGMVLLPRRKVQPPPVAISMATYVTAQVVVRRE